MKRLTINPILAKLPFDKFKAWHKRTLPDDDQTAEARYIEIGGKIPVKPVKKDK